MTQARVTHFCRSFSDVVASGAQQLRRAFHSYVAKILWNGETDFARKNPAQIKRAAAHFLSQHFQRRRVREIALQNLPHTFDSLARQAFLTHAEKFGVFWREKKLRHELQCLALIPKDLRSLCHRRLRQILVLAPLLHRRWTDRRAHSILLLS